MGQNYSPKVLATGCTGQIKFFKADKGFGFISNNDNGKDVFVHVTGIKDQDIELRKDDEVTFDIHEGKKGPIAVNVQKA